MAAVAAHMRAIAELTPVQKAGSAWCAELLADAEREVRCYVEAASGSAAASGLAGGPPQMLASDWRAATAVFCIGEVALTQVSPALQACVCPVALKNRNRTSPTTASRVLPGGMRHWCVPAGRRCC